MMRWFSFGILAVAVASVIGEYVVFDQATGEVVR